MTGATNHLDYRLDGKVAVLQLDDGKANAFSPELIKAVHDALDRAEKEARATVIAGRPGRFSAGFDLARMTASADSARDLVTRGAEMMIRLALHPQPLIVACTGHALAAGALVLLAADYRIGAEGPFKVGLNEVAIGLRLPIFAVELARARLSKRHLNAATILGRVYDPTMAVDAGYLDEVVAVEQVVSTALERARPAAELPTGAHAETKRLLRGAMVEHMRATLAEDMAGIGMPTNVAKK